MKDEKSLNSGNLSANLDSGDGGRSLKQADSKVSSEKDEFGPQGPSAVNLRLGRLRKAALKVVNTRSKVPQPFFWSLLHSELREIKKMKRRAQDERDAWIRGDTGDTEDKG